MKIVRELSRRSTIHGSILTLSLVFLAIPSQYSLKCLVISLRLDVSSWDKGLVVHALEAAINLHISY